MAHIPEDDNFDEFMDASAEEWSKPEETSPQPETGKEQTDRWGSPTPQKGTSGDANRWGSEQPDSSTPVGDPQKKKGGSKWWIIAIIIVVVLCLCLCGAFFALSRMDFGGFEFLEIFRNRFIP